MSQPTDPGTSSRGKTRGGGNSMLYKPSRDDGDRRFNHRERDRSSKYSGHHAPNSKGSRYQQSAEPNAGSNPPTILLKTRATETRSLSPVNRPQNVSSVTSPSTASTRDITTPTKEQLKDGFKVPGRRDVPATGSTPQPSLKALIMTEPVKLLNEELGFQNSLLEYLSDDQDFLVIGCVGSQWSGKSSLLSHLAASNCSHFVKQTFFNIANPGVQMKGAVGTVGLDVYITSDRVIWLDCQPLLSAALAERELTSGFSKEYCKDNLSNSSCVGTLVEVQSLQLLSFLYCICHVLIVVQDSLADPNLIRLLQTAEMLKPNLAADESLLDNMPHLVVVYNRARPADLAPEILQKTLKFHQLAFKKSRLQITSSGIFKDNVNFIALLELSLPAGRHQRNDYKKSVPELKRALLALPRKSFNMGPTILSEKSWFTFANKSWEAVRKSSLMMEYARLLQ